MDALLLCGTPLPANDYESPRQQTVSLFHTVQLRAAQIDDTATQRAGAFLARLAELPLPSATVERPVRRVVVDLLPALAAASAAPEHAQASSALSQVLTTSLWEKGGALEADVADALADCIEGSDGKDTPIAPVLRVLGAAPSLAELQRVVGGLLGRARKVLASCGEQKQRLRVLGFAGELWAAASGRWSAEADAADGMRDLAASLMNFAVSSALYDPSAKLRLAATRLLGQLASALAPEEVRKLAMLKARDKDKEVRKAALKVLGTVHGSDDDAAALLDDDALGGPLYSAAQVQQLVVNGLGGAAPPLALEKSVASSAFWRLLIARQADAPAALRELRASEQLPVYEPLLRQHIEELYAATFPADDPSLSADEDAGEGADSMSADGEGGDGMAGEGAEYCTGEGGSGGGDGAGGDAYVDGEYVLGDGDGGAWVEGEGLGQSGDDPIEV